VIKVKEKVVVEVKLEVKEKVKMERFGGDK
jgi:hypothetical protein